MLSELALSGLTDLILASFQAFAAGLLFGRDSGPGSPARLWSWTMSLTAAIFLLGALDHSFFEPVNHPWHPMLMGVNRALVAVASFMIALTAAVQFLGRTGRKIVCAIAALISALVVVMVFLSDNFLIVIACYSAAMMLMLVLNLLGLRDGKGSVAMIAGILITFAASAIPFAGGQAFAGLGVYAAYHVALMPAVVAFYFAGVALDNRPAPVFLTRFSSEPSLRET